MMKYILITAAGKVKMFYIAGLAHSYQRLYGGVVIEQHVDEAVDSPVV
jgi:hypothetical protein